MSSPEMTSPDESGRPAPHPDTGSVSAQPAVAQAAPPVQAPVERTSWISRLLSSNTLPTTLSIGFIVVALGFAASNFMPKGGLSFLKIGAPEIVTFDPVKFINAQRAAASILAARPNADLAFSITQVASQADAVIREEAGGAMVVVKQALVLPDDVPDITDAVLKRFGLPTNSPTVTTDLLDPDALESYAPSNSAFARERYEEDERMRKTEQAFDLESRVEMLDQHNNLLP